jgi:hypothetical protein
MRKIGRTRGPITKVGTGCHNGLVKIPTLLDSGSTFGRRLAAGFGSRRTFNRMSRSRKDEEVFRTTTAPFGDETRRRLAFAMMRDYP